MRDERRIIVVEDHRKSGEGWGKVFGTLFLVVMALALLDRGFTVVWRTLATWVN
ncbi:hypothetical protein [Agrobacterium fabrum]|uniref:hypothetical protein n=1 Tax=Agrobacterium fabrum TaxID=1176649 RepID=UPI003B9F4763